MLDFKGLLFGTVTTTIIFLTSQLIFILVAAYSGLAGVESAFWTQYKEIIWQGMGIATMCFSMLLGGALMRCFVGENQALHGFIVGAIISLFFAWSTAGRGDINLTGILVFTSGALCCALGAHYSPWPKQRKVDSPVLV